MRSDNGYEGHLDFLEAHGFITSEDREAELAAFKHYEDYPEQYTTLTFEEAFKRLHSQEESTKETK